MAKLSDAEPGQSAEKVGMPFVALFWPIPLWPYSGGQVGVFLLCASSLETLSQPICSKMSNQKPNLAVREGTDPGGQLGHQEQYCADVR